MRQWQNTQRHQGWAMAKPPQKGARLDFKSFKPRQELGVPADGLGEKSINVKLNVLNLDSLYTPMISYDILYLIVDLRFFS